MKAKFVAAILVIALIGYVAAGPFITIQRIRSALDRQDSEALASNVDFPALRASLKEQFDAFAVKQAAHDLKDNPFGVLGAFFVSKLAEGAVDAIVTPSGLAALMAGRRPQQADSAPPPEASLGWGLTLFRNARYTYDGISKFSAWVRNADGAEVRFVFTRHDLSWELSNVIVPMEQWENNGSKSSKVATTAQPQTSKVATREQLQDYQLRIEADCKNRGRENGQPADKSEAFCECMIQVLKRNMTVGEWQRAYDSSEDELAVVQPYFQEIEACASPGAPTEPSSAPQTEVYRTPQSAGDASMSAPVQVAADTGSGPSFSCAWAKSTAERLICSDADLARQDRELAALYTQAKAVAPDKVAFVRQSTAEWHRRESTCVDKDCLIAWYATRRAELSQIVGAAP